MLDIPGSFISNCSPLSLIGSLTLLPGVVQVVLTAGDDPGGGEAPHDLVFSSSLCWGSVLRVLGVQGRVEQECLEN